MLPPKPVREFFISFSFSTRQLLINTDVSELIAKSVVLPFSVILKVLFSYAVSLSEAFFISLFFSYISTRALSLPFL